jgi:hypothetical protein
MHPVYLRPAFQPVDLEQRIGRIHRYGQQDMAQVYNLSSFRHHRGQHFPWEEQAAGNRLCNGNQRLRSEPHLRRPAMMNFFSFYLLRRRRSASPRVAKQLIGRARELSAQGMTSEQVLDPTRSQASSSRPGLLWR